MKTERDGECKCLYPFHISCTKLYAKYEEGMLGYYPIPLYPNSIYMIVLNVLHSPRRKLSMKLQPHLPVQCDCSLSPPFPSSPFSFLPLPSFFFFSSFFLLSPSSSPPLFLFPSLSPPPL